MDSPFFEEHFQIGCLRRFKIIKKEVGENNNAS